MLEFNINLIGPKAQKNIPDVLRYEPGFSVDLLADLALPIGEYDSSQPLNLGQNRWYGRLGLPIVWQLGPWVPGRRTTLEFLPAVWLFGDNDDYVGQTLKTDPMFQLDAHLTRDFTEHFWGSLDAAWYTGGQGDASTASRARSSTTSASGSRSGTRSTTTWASPSATSRPSTTARPGDLRMDGFMVSLVYGWHPLVEGARRLKSE